MRVLFLLSLLCVLSACQPVDKTYAPKFDISEFKPAGEATLKRVNTRTFIHPSGNLSLDDELDFWDGFSFFRDPWIAAPAVTEDRDGLGPLFNARSCKACHARGGRGREPVEGVSKPMALLIRLGAKIDGAKVDENYGGQLQPFAIRLSHKALSTVIEPEAEIKLKYEFINGTYADGSSYQLRKPSYELVNLNYGKLEESTVLSPRYAPAIYGMGLLDAIKEEDLLALEDIADSNNDGISAKYNLVPDVLTQKVAVGRFGFKALHPSLAQQTAGAFVNDIGITNPFFQSDTCSHIQIGCRQRSLLGGHDKQQEIPEKLHDLTVYMGQHVAVQPTRSLKSKQAQLGREIFYQLNCHSCHQPSFKTDESYPVKELAGQKIWPYTDLALHDMGEGLSDGKAEFKATGSEWRTAPLWGLGLQKHIQGYQAFLHDGRARTLEEAILWHGGEAKSSQQAFIKLDKSQRDAVIFFLKQI
ncbi:MULTISPECIES: di-heme oxidoredictase family protein [unclassified Pseudoalteromonas]|uniref:di-heme oxidoreductase family protein n=1 Tax=unclassified Pseudoalteromonas TaxID=194690 RepID=UPI0005AA0B1D|nr:MULTISPECIES: di-heme oxidoredictase family protein [unclassified Pseudoalteromonas]